MEVVERLGSTGEAAGVVDTSIGGAVDTSETLLPVGLDLWASIDPDELSDKRPNYKNIHFMDAHFCPSI